jgi:hypothetical protein
MKTAKSKTTTSASAEKQLAGFIAKFEPAHAKLIRECRTELRKLLPTAIELVYDNYNFFVIGYCTTPRASDCIVSIAAAANGVGLSFYHGAALADPEKLLQGGGRQNRFVRLPSVEVLRSRGVAALIKAAVVQSKTPLLKTGGGQLVIQSISAKQKPRRKPAGAKK